jgi:hypothetical protein
MAYIVKELLFKINNITEYVFLTLDKIILEIVD